MPLSLSLGIKIGGLTMGGVSIPQAPVLSDAAVTVEAGIATFTGVIGTEGNETTITILWGTVDGVLPNEIPVGVYSEDGSFSKEVDSDTFPSGEIFWQFKAESVGGVVFSTQQATKVNQIPQSLKDGNCVGYFDFLDISNMAITGSEISEITDKLGSEVKMTGSCTFNELGAIFNGISHFMQSELIASLKNKVSIYAVIKQITWTSGRFFFDGTATNHCGVSQFGTYPQIRMQSGLTSIFNNDMPLDVYVLLRVRFDGANSTIQVNDNTMIVGNPGNRDMGRLVVGRGGGGTGNGNFQITDLIVRSVFDAADDYQEIGDYLKKKLN